MFNATGWLLCDADLERAAGSVSEVAPPGGGARLSILKIFEFDHKRQPSLDFACSYVCACACACVRLCVHVFV